MATNASSKKFKIAVFVNDQVEFFSIEPVLLALQKNPAYQVDLIMDPYKTDDTGIKEMVSHVKTFIETRDQKVTALDSVKHKKYHLCLAPYYRQEITADCWLRFSYSSISSKPDFAYQNVTALHFDAFFALSTIAANLYSVYGQTHLVENLRFVGTKPIKRPATKKPVLLFAPTYNDGDPAKLAQAITKLKEKYFVVTKSHHGTEYRKVNSAAKSALLDTGDLNYSPDTSIIELMLMADVCVTNNSSAYADALYAGTPVAFFADDLDKFKFGQLHTSQSRFAKEGIIPACSKVSSLLATVDLALTKDIRTRQRALAQELFPKHSKTGIRGYLDVIDYYLTSPAAQDYLILHQYNVDYQSGNLRRALVGEATVVDKEKIIKERDRTIAELTQALARYQNFPPIRLARSLKLRLKP